MEIKIIKEKISKEELASLVENNFEDMAKVDVDIEKGILSIGGEWHSEGQDLLVKEGSLGKNIWGVNFFPWEEVKNRIVYNSLINLKPSLNHRSMDIKNEKTKLKIKEIVNKLLLSDNETI